MQWWWWWGDKQPALHLVPATCRCIGGRYCGKGMLRQGESVGNHRLTQGFQGRKPNYKGRENFDALGCWWKETTFSQSNAMAEKGLICMSVPPVTAHPSSVVDGIHWELEKELAVDPLMFANCLCPAP